MIVGVRPSIGFVAYLVIGKSWLRMTLLFVVLIVATLTLLRRSQESITLQFTRSRHKCLSVGPAESVPRSPTSKPLASIGLLGLSWNGGDLQFYVESEPRSLRRPEGDPKKLKPSHLPPPLIILPFPNHETITAFDACAAEAAAHSLPVNKSSLFPTKSRPVYFYLWSPDVAPSNVWAKVIANIKGIRLSFLDINKAVERSPISGMFLSGGWAGKPDWAVWMASGFSLLWTSGGILIPNGVLMTKPLHINVVERNTGLLVADGHQIRSAAIGVPSHHVLTKTILENIQKYNYASNSNSDTGKTSSSFYLDKFLTTAVGEVCEISSLATGDCHDFTVFNSSIVKKFHLHSAVDIKLENELTLLQCDGKACDMTFDLRTMHHLFRKHGFHRFCPYVDRFLEREMMEAL